MSNIHPFLLRIPLQLWHKLYQHLKYGQTATDFIIRAIQEKLDKEQ